MKMRLPVPRTDNLVTFHSFNKMALSPTAAIESRDTKRNEQIAAIETGIDTLLAESFETNQFVYDLPPGTKTAVYNEIVNRYRNAGWIVEERVDFHGTRQIVLQSPT